MLTFRHASEADLPVIVDIYNSTIAGRMVTADTEPVTVASREAWYHAHSPERRPLWIMELDGQIAGWISLQNFYGRPAYNGTAELSIYLHESSRGKGLGRIALQFAIDQCPSVGVNNLMGIIFAHNQPSIKLFESMGFEQWALMPDIAVLDNITRSVVILGKKI